MKTIWKREIRSYFHTPSGYIFSGVFLLLSSLMFYLMILQQRSSDIPSFIGLMSYLWMLLSPVLTMRLLTEERQKKTDQLLLTSPVSLTGIVIGKYLAALTVLVCTVAMTLLFCLIVAIYGEIYPAEAFVCYLGFILQGCAFLALDLFVSSFTIHPASAAALAFGANFVVWMMDMLANSAIPAWLSEGLAFLSLYSRNEPFLMGQLSFANIIFDLSMIAAFLGMTIHVMDSRRYRGIRS